LIDALSTLLRRVARGGWKVPAGVNALVRLFPVLRRVPAIAEAPQQWEVPDPQESLKRAAQALHEIVAQLAPVVLYLDDVQWGDRDSAAFLGSLPAFLLVCQRSDEPSPLLDKLDVRFLDLEALSPSETHELAVALVGGDEAEAIARDSGGSPLFVHELARHGRAGGSSYSSYEEVLAARVRELPEDAQRLLTMVAMAGGPIPVAVARAAAELESDEHAALSLLRAEQLVRWREHDIETFHDRIRSSLTASLSEDERRRCHERLVIALEAIDHDPEALVEHLVGAGQRERAAKQAEMAADRAMAALAFDRAARLYRAALVSEGARALWIKLGDALVNAGRGAEAAAAYSRALRGAAKSEALELRRRMAEQLLRSGHFDAGLAAVRDVLAEVGMALAPSPERALASLVLGRARIRLRGLNFFERAVAPEELTRIDVCWSIATAVGVIDFIRGADFQTRHLLLALAAGEPERVARGLAIEAAYSSGSGGRSRARTRRLLTAARELAVKVGSPHLDGLTETVSGIAAFLEGRWSDAHGACARGEKIFRDRCRGVAWELASSEFFGLGALYYLGSMRELAELVPQRLREAEERGDLYRATGLRSWRTNVAWLVGDQPDVARAQIVEAALRWTRQGFHLQHYYELFSHCQIDLYEGDAARAHSRIASAWPKLERSMLLRIQNTRVESWYLRARAALGIGQWRAAERDARRLEREGMAWAQPYALAVRAAVAWQRSGVGRAELERAIAGFEGASMLLFAAAARRHLGTMTGRTELVAEADQHMNAQGIVDPTRMARMLVPFNRHL
ncbi:MAG TPA: hypothetical protein VFB62_20505, partial [Polyangiaceae bacterium]|nr:hypothetical protein [Polyangiaceae bacterium]